MPSRFLRLALVALPPLLFGGCLTVGGGPTERDWNAAIASLAPGLTQEQLLSSMGEPRERIPADVGETAFTETWIYSRPEITGTRPVMTGEHEVRLPNGQHTVLVPDYSDQAIKVIAEYHLRWQGDTLVDWERKELR